MNKKASDPISRRILPKEIMLNHLSEDDYDTLESMAMRMGKTTQEIIMNLIHSNSDFQKFKRIITSTPNTTLLAYSGDI